MEPRTLPKGPCEAQQAPEERHSASDDAHSALSEAQVARTPLFLEGFRPPRPFLNFQVQTAASEKLPFYGIDMYGR